MNFCSLPASLLILLSVYIPVSAQENKVFRADTLVTGWYYITDSNSHYNRQLAKTELIYYLDPNPIITVKNFLKTHWFHEKSCYMLIVSLDSTGAKLIHLASEPSKNKKIALIIANQLIRIQNLSDPQFMRSDLGMYNDIILIPCFTFTAEEIKIFAAQLGSEQKNSK